MVIRVLTAIVFGIYLDILNAFPYSGQFGLVEHFTR